MDKQLKIAKDGMEGQTLPESLHVWEELGWTVVDDESSENHPEKTDDPRLDPGVKPNDQTPGHTPAEQPEKTKPERKDQ